MIEGQLPGRFSSDDSMLYISNHLFARDNAVIRSIILRN